MPEFWTYSLADFVLFTPRVYYRLFELRNAALWPAHVLTFGLGLTMVFLVARPSSARIRMTLTICGAMWLWVAWSFFWTDYASINWAAAYFAPVVAVQGVLLIGAGVMGAQPEIARRHNPPSIVALGLLAFAVAGYPFIAPAVGRAWTAAEVFGMAPDPTAIATMATLVLAGCRIRWWLMLVPTVWCVISGLTLRAMEVGDFFIAPVSAIIAVALMLVRLRS